MPLTETKKTLLLNQLYLLFTGLLLTSGILGGHFSGINSISMMVLFLLWIVEGKFSTKWERIKSNHLLWCTSLFFLLYAISMIVSANHGRAAELLLRELPLFILPLIYITKNPFTKEAIYGMLRWLVYAATIWMSVATIMALRQYTITGDPSVMVYHALAGNIGSTAIYASMVCIICVAVILFMPTNSRWKTIFYCLFTIWLILLASRMFLFILLLLSVINLLVLLPGKFRIWMTGGLILVIALFSLTNNPVKTRFLDLEKFHSDYLTRPRFATDIYFDGLSLRLIYIRYSLEIMHEHHSYLTGVGTGNAAEMLREKIRAYDMSIGDGSNTERGGYLQYSFHNVYLESFVALGIPGLLSILLLYGYIFWTGIRKRISLLRDLAIIMILSSTTDVIVVNEQCDVSLLFVICCLVINLYGDKWQQNDPGIAV